LARAQRLRNCCKINDRIWSNLIGFLATLIMTIETGSNAYKICAAKN
jgi:hypothetical protein